jgi:hypothetical protein
MSFATADMRRACCIRFIMRGLTPLLPSGGESGPFRFNNDALCLIPSAAQSLPITILFATIVLVLSICRATRELNVSTSGATAVQYPALSRVANWLCTAGTIPTINLKKPFTEMNNHYGKRKLQ